jgi:Methyltransferase domain
VSFASEWLALREPYDTSARSRDVLAAVAAAFAGQSAIAVVDLACGTGSTLRAVAPRLPARQTWRLVDNDLGLLARAGASAHPTGVSVTTTLIDLARDVEAALDGALDLVTTSALLDLVSAEWLERLVVEVAARRLPLYAALTYDGRIELTPPDPFDQRIIAAVNRHQQTDKGFGPALGPDAAAAAARQCAIVQYEITQGSSDWVFGPQDGEIQNEVLAGWAGAAREIGEPLDDVVKWLTRRRDLVAAGRSSMRVGHIDIFARPTATR